MSSSFQPDQAAFQGDWASSSSSASSSTRSSTPRPLPDEILRSFQFFNQQRDHSSNANAIIAHSRRAGSSVQHSVSADDQGAATSANDENHAQGRGDIDLSGLSDHDLDLVIANLEARASERRYKIRKIEALSEELGLNIHGQDWAALLRRPAAGSIPSIAGGQGTSDPDEAKDQADAPEYLEPMPISETHAVHELTVADDASANSCSDVHAEPAAPRRSLRVLRRLNRAHYQSEQQKSGGADCHEGGEMEEVATGPRSPIQTQSIPPEGSENGSVGQSDSSMVSVDAGARRNAWSVVLEKYPEEIATKFKPGERPTNKQVKSMASFFKSRQSHSSTVNAEASLIYLPSMLWRSIRSVAVESGL